ncbi:MAG: hypothetical protein WCB12_16540 [Bryobacteraceae bacterium]
MSPLAAGILRWLARLSALFFACVFLLILVREFLAPQYGPPVSAVEWAGVAFLLIAAAGMVLAWKWGLTGALISIAALVLHISVVRNRTYAVIWFAAIPLVLFVADWLLHRLRPPARTTTP